MALQQHPKYPNLRVIQNSLLENSLSTMRNRDVDYPEFASIASRMAPFVVCEALQDWQTIRRPIITPVSEIHAPFLMSRNATLVSILGAGMALLSDVREKLLPWAREAYIAASRDDNNNCQPVLHYDRLPEDLSLSLTVVLDPMLATGGSSSAVIQLLKERCGANNLILVCIVAAPEGVLRMQREHPDVRIVTLALDRRLTKEKFISPGLGDFGDRFTGVKPSKK